MKTKEWKIKFGDRRHLTFPSSPSLRDTSFNSIPHSVPLNVDHFRVFVTLLTIHTLYDDAKNGGAYPMCFVDDPHCFLSSRAHDTSASVEEDSLIIMYMGLNVSIQ